MDKMLYRPPASFVSFREHLLRLSAFRPRQRNISRGPLCVVLSLTLVQAFCNSPQYKYQGLSQYRQYTQEGPIDLMAQFMPEDPVILEAGAHYGEHTECFARKWRTAKILAFEPNPHAFELLQQRTCGFENVFPYQLALNDRNGQAVLHVCYGSTGDNPIYEGASSLLEASKCQAIHYQGPKVMVDCVILDDWCEINGIDHINCMWLDLEGLELQVLRSSPKILESVKLIFTETNFFELRKGMTQYAELSSFLEKAGFKLIAHWYTEGLQGDALFVRKEPFEN